MKSGTRALGVAESFARDAPESTLAATVVRADRAVDGLAYGRCTVGGTDATSAIADCYHRLDRPDVRYLLVAGVALAWYNVVDPAELADATDRPVVAVSFEESDGLRDALHEAFSGDELDDRLDRYDRLPARKRVAIDGRDLFFRAVGVSDDEAETVLAALTHGGGRPEPLRVARVAARAGDALRRGEADATGASAGRDE